MCYSCITLTVSHATIFFKENITRCVCGSEEAVNAEIVPEKKIVTKIFAFEFVKN